MGGIAKASLGMHSIYRVSAIQRRTGRGRWLWKTTLRNNGGDLDALSAFAPAFSRTSCTVIFASGTPQSAKANLFQQTWLRVAEKVGNTIHGLFEAWLPRWLLNLAIDHPHGGSDPSLVDTADTAGESAAARLPSHERPAISEGILARTPRQAGRRTRVAADDAAKTEF